MPKPGSMFTRQVLAICGAVLVALLSGWTAGYAVAQVVQQDSTALQEFNTRVQTYVNLHKRIAASLPPIPQSSDPAVILKRQQDFASSMRAARANAAKGDVFIPGVRPVFLKIIKEELSGPSAAQARNLILGEGNPKSAESPATVVLKVNEPYPSTAPLSTVPPLLLLRLPKVPEQLDYRFVGRTLILRDTKANVIVDLLPEAVP